MVLMFVAAKAPVTGLPAVVVVVAIFVVAAFALKVPLEVSFVVSQDLFVLVIVAARLEV